MTPAQQPPHPQRCETCSHYGGHICYQQHNRMSNIELTLIEMVGCASHSNASSQRIEKPMIEGIDGEMVELLADDKEIYLDSFARFAKNPAVDMLIQMFRDKAALLQAGDPK